MKHTTAPVVREEMERWRRRVVAPAGWVLAALAALCTGDRTMAQDGVPLRVEAQVAALYDAGMDDINRAVGRALDDLDATPERRSAQYRLTRAAALAASIERVLGSTEGKSRAVIEPATAKAIKGSISLAESQMREMGLSPSARTPGGQALGLSFAEVTPGEIETIARDTVARANRDTATSLRGAAQSHATNARTIFRTLSESLANAGGTIEPTVNRAIARGLISGDPVIADRAIRDLFRDPKAPQRESVRKLGNKIVEVGRAQMPVRAYAMTVVRTRTREATVSARHDRLGLSGISLVQITGATSENFCTAFLGLVCSLQGEQTVEGVAYPALSSLPGGGPPFHPNCSKGTAAYVPELVSASRSRLHANALRTFNTRQRTGRLLAPVKA